MDALDVGPDSSTPVRTRRRASRGRLLMATGLVAVLGWTGVSFMAATGETGPAVSVLPGASADGRVADVYGLTDTVSSSQGNSFKQSGVKFARVDVASAYQDRIRVTLAWQNPSDFARNTGNGAWQLRLGLYYPVRTGSCTGSDPAHAVTVTLSASESYTNGTPQTFCAYRDLTATGPGAVTAVNDQDRGTQLVASDWLLGTLQPQATASNPSACGPSGTTVCLPDGLGANKRTYLVIGTLLNPGGKAPPGQVGGLLGVELFVRASKVGA